MRSRSTVLTAALLVLCFGVSYSGAAECLQSMCSPAGLGAETRAEREPDESHCHPAAATAHTSDHAAPVTAPADLEHGCCQAKVAADPSARSLAPTAPEAQAVATEATPLASLPASPFLTARAPPPTSGPPLFRLHRALLL